MSAAIIALAAGVGSGAGAVTATVATLSIQERRVRKHLMLFHHGVECPGHDPGTPAAKSRICPAAEP